MIVDSSQYKSIQQVTFGSQKLQIVISIMMTSGHLKDEVRTYSKVFRNISVAFFPIVTPPKLAYDLTVVSNNGANMRSALINFCP